MWSQRDYVIHMALQFRDGYKLIQFLIALVDSSFVFNYFTIVRLMCLFNLVLNTNANITCCLKILLKNYFMKCLCLSNLGIVVNYIELQTTLQATCCIPVLYQSILLRFYHHLRKKLHVISISLQFGELQEPTVEMHARTQYQYSWAIINLETPIPC